MALQGATERDRKDRNLKNIGATAVVVGFVAWFGGEFVGFPNVIGLGILIIGAVLYFVGRKRQKAAAQPPPLPRP